MTQSRKRGRSPVSLGIHLGVCVCLLSWFYCVFGIFLHRIVWPEMSCCLLGCGFALLLHTWLLDWQVRRSVDLTGDFGKSEGGGICICVNDHAVSAVVHNHWSADLEYKIPVQWRPVCLQCEFTIVMVTGAFTPEQTCWILLSLRVSKLNLILWTMILNLSDFGFLS